MNWFLLIDIVIVAVTCLSIWRGSRDGLIRTLFHSFTYIIAVLCAYFLSSPIAARISAGFMYEAMTEKVGKALHGIDVAGGVDSVAQLTSDKLSGIIRLFNIDINKIAEEAVLKSENIMEEMTGKIAEALSGGISKILAFILVFIVAIIALKILAVLLDLLAKLPVLNAFNRIGGILLGVVRGVLICFVLVQLCALISPFILPSSGAWIEQTILAEFLYNIFPLHLS